MTKQICYCDAYAFPHRLGGGRCVADQDFDDDPLYEHEHPDEDQCPRGYRPRHLSYDYFEPEEAAVRY